MLQTRLLTAAVALPILLALIVLAPAWVFSVFIALCAAWGLYEVAAMTAADSPALIGLVAAVGVAAVIVTLAWAPGWSAVPAALAIALMCRLIVRIRFASGENTPPRPLLATIGALYVGALFPHFAMLRNLPDGVRLVLLMLAAVVAGDSGAYFVGRSVGRVKLIPEVSPGKTVEGAVAYVLCSVAAVCIIEIPLGLGWSLGTTAGFGALISVVAQAGDLAESAFKRMAGVKDSGWLFPGHGGLLDRADSLVFAAVFAYYYGRWLGLAAA